MNPFSHLHTLWDVVRDVAVIASAPAVDKIKMTVTTHFLWRQ